MDMDEAEVREKVKKVFLEVFSDLGENDFDFSKKQDSFENWDSLAHMQLVNGIEAAFGIQLAMEEIVEIQSPEAFAELVGKKLR
jgi:acyl carrier protein